MQPEANCPRLHSLFKMSPLVWRANFLAQKAANLPAPADKQITHADAPPPRTNRRRRLGAQR